MTATSPIIDISMGFLVILSVVSCLAVAVSGVEDRHYVTCGSAIQLRHISSKKYFLKSSAHNFGSSGQQVVTLDVNVSPGELLWQIREAHNTTACTTGNPIKCDTVLRLIHVNTNKNLHSHNNPAPLSRFNYEVSGFGSDGQGDNDDNWQVRCMHSKGMDPNEELWESHRPVRFRHVGTGHFLAANTKSKFNQANCPHCPIHGELEVSGTSRNSDAALQSTIFSSGDGAYVGL